MQRQPPNSSLCGKGIDGGTVVSLSPSSLSFGTISRWAQPARYKRYADEDGSLVIVHIGSREITGQNTGRVAQQ